MDPNNATTAAETPVGQNPPPAIHPDIQTRYFGKEPLPEVLRVASEEDVGLCEARKIFAARTARPDLLPKRVARTERDLEKAKQALEEAAQRQAAEVEISREWNDLVSELEMIKETIDQNQAALNRWRREIKEERAKLFNRVASHHEIRQLLPVLATEIASAEAGVLIYEEACKQLDQKLAAHIVRMREFGGANGVPEECWPTSEVAQ